MAKQAKNAATAKQGDEAVLRARITAKSADDMLRLLKGRPLEMVGRGPHKRGAEEYVAEVIATRKALEAIPKGDWSVEIREARSIKDPEKHLSRGNRYEKAGNLPRGLGKKTGGER